MAGKITQVLRGMRVRLSDYFKKSRSFIRKRPFLSFYIALALFVLAIVLSSLFQAKPETQVQENPPKEVSLYSIGTAPRINVQAQIEKTGLVRITALAGGVVQKVHFREGGAVSKGNTLFSLSTNYQGGVAQSVQRSLAQAQYQSALDTFGIQTELIAKQRDAANKTEENADELRQISADSRSRTRELIDLNKSILDNINSSITNLENGSITPSPGNTPESAIAALSAQKAQLLAGLAQAESSLANLDYQSDEDNPPAQLAQIQKDIALKQLELQEKMLTVNREAARLQLQLAQITEAIMYPAAPFSGTIQRVLVTEGDVVAPGQQLAVLLQNIEDDPITAVAYVSSDIASKISRTEESILKIGNQKLFDFPYFVSSEAVSGNLYAAYYSVPDQYANYVTDGGYIEIEIPIGTADSNSAFIYVPVDAIYQTEDEAFTYVVSSNQAVSRKLTLGSVYGSFVRVESGLKSGDQVILTRNVVEGDKIKLTN